DGDRAYRLQGNREVSRSWRVILVDDCQGQLHVDALGEDCSGERHHERGKPADQREIPRVRAQIGALACTRASNAGDEHCQLRSTRTDIPGRNPTTLSTGRARTSKVLMSYPLDCRVARHVAYSPLGLM